MTYFSPSLPLSAFVLTLPLSPLQMFKSEDDWLKDSCGVAAQTHITIKRLFLSAAFALSNSNLLFKVFIILFTTTPFSMCTLRIWLLSCLQQNITKDEPIKYKISAIWLRLVFNWNKLCIKYRCRCLHGHNPLHLFAIVHTGRTLTPPHCRHPLWMNPMPSYP